MSPHWPRGEQHGTRFGFTGVIPAFARMPDHEETSYSPTADLDRTQSFQTPRLFGPGIQSVMSEQQIGEPVCHFESAGRRVERPHSKSRTTDFFCRSGMVVFARTVESRHAGS